MPSIESSYGGPVRSLIGYLDAGASVGHEQDVAAPAPTDRGSELFSSRTQVEWRLFGSLGSGSSAFSPGLLRWLAYHATDYDIVHVHGLFNPISSGAARVALRRGVPLVLRPFGTLSKYTFAHRRGAVKRAYFRMFDRPNVQGADAIHFTTAGEKADAAWHGIEFGPRAHIVPPPFIGGIPSVAATPAGNAVLFLARLHPVKHAELLIDSWPAVLREIPGASLVIAGGGDTNYVRSLFERVTSKGLDSSIWFAGNVDERKKAELFASAELFVLPSYHENFGISALEAAAAGLPVLTTREVHLSAFLEAYGLGRVVERDARSLADAIVSMLRDARLGNHCRSEGPHAVRQEFSAAAAGGRLEAMYRAALGVRRRRIRLNNEL